MNPETNAHLTYIDLDLDDDEIFVLLHANLYSESDWNHYLDHWVDDVTNNVIIPQLKLYIELPENPEYDGDYDADRGSPSCRAYVKIPVSFPDEINEDVLSQQFLNNCKPLIQQSFDIAFGT